MMVGMKRHLEVFEGSGEEEDDVRAVIDLGEEFREDHAIVGVHLIGNHWL